jgi:hypothetical protein
MTNLLEFSKRVVDIAYDGRQETLTAERLENLSIIYGLTPEQNQLYVNLSAKALEEEGGNPDVNYLPYSIANSIDAKLHDIVGL